MSASTLPPERGIPSQAVLLRLAWETVANATRPRPPGQPEEARGTRRARRPRRRRGGGR